MEGPFWGCWGPSHASLYLFRYIPAYLTARQPENRLVPRALEIEKDFGGSALYTRWTRGASLLILEPATKRLLGGFPSPFLG